MGDRIRSIENEYKVIRGGEEPAGKLLKGHYQEKDGALASLHAEASVAPAYGAGLSE
jgi:hypothetical protein